MHFHWYYLYLSFACVILHFHFHDKQGFLDFSLLVENVNDDRDGEVNDDKNKELNDDKPICDGRLQTSEGQDNSKIDDLCLGKERIVNVSKCVESKSPEGIFKK
jgi:hypothetical protein